MVIHNKNFFCRECGKKFWLQEALDEHFKIVHLENNSRGKRKEAKRSKGKIKISEDWKESGRRLRRSKY